MCDGQHVVAIGSAAEACLGVEQAAGVATREGDAHVVVGGGQPLLGRDGCWLASLVESDVAGGWGGRHLRRSAVC